MTDDEITLPPLPAPGFALRELELWGQNQLVGLYDGNQMHAFARAAVLLARQQRAALSVHLPHVESALRAILAVAEGDSNPTICLIADTARIALRHTPTPPDHTALLRQALEALEKARDTTYSDTLYPQFEVAIDALRAALGEKR